MEIVTTKLPGIGKAQAYLSSTNLEENLEEIHNRATTTLA